jgi:hypothetical protein
MFQGKLQPQTSTSASSLQSSLHAKYGSTKLAKQASKQRYVTPACGFHVAHCQCRYC